jgi:hypothetical protein
MTEETKDAKWLKSVKEPTWINLGRLRLTNNSGQTLSLAYRNGFPRWVIVYDQDNSKEWKERIETLPHDMVTLSYIGETIKRLTPEEVTTTEVAFKHHEWKDDKPTDNIVEIGSLLISNKTGIPVLSFKVPGREPISFKLVPNKKWFSIRDSEGNDIIDKKETVYAYAYGYADLLNMVSSQIALKD